VFIYGGAIDMGIKWKLVGGLSMRGDYDCIKYANIAYHSGRVILPGISRQCFNTRNKLSTSQFLLGLTYRC